MYTISDFITHAQAGDPIQITDVTANTNVVMKIGSRVVELSADRLSWTVTDGIKTTIHTDTRILDLGTLFSAEQVLSSDTLRKAIIDGLVIADAGTVALSLIPTV